MIKEVIGKVIAGEDLSAEEAYNVMNEIMDGGATDAQIAAFITALRLKGETVDEITGFTRVMREKATRIEHQAENVVDTCGTGGDGAHTFNISTAAAIVAAAAGAVVAKHGNRSVSSSCGSADVLKELGVNIEIEKEQVEKCIDEVGIGFLFAPLLHKAMKYAIGPRREIGIRTVFNILGPLTNPAGAQAQLLGVYDGALTETMAAVLGNLGSTHVFVVHGEDGLDEISITSATNAPGDTLPSSAGYPCTARLRGPNASTRIPSFFSISEQFSAAAICSAVTSIVSGIKQRCTATAPWLTCRYNCSKMIRSCRAC